MSSKPGPEGIDLTTSARGIAIDASDLSGRARTMTAALDALAAAWLAMPSWIRRAIGTVTVTMTPDGKITERREKVEQPKPHEYGETT